MSRRPELLRWFIGGLLIAFLFWNLVNNGFAYSPSESGNALSLLEEFETAQAVSNSSDSDDIDDGPDDTSALLLTISDDVRQILTLLESRSSQGDEVSAVLNEYYTALEDMQQVELPEDQEQQPEESPIEVAEVSTVPEEDSLDSEEVEFQEEASISTSEEGSAVTLETIHNDLIFLIVSLWALGAICFAFKLGGATLGK